MMRRHPLLFGLTIMHGYFADPARCRFDFLPDVTTAEWLRRAGCVVRSFGNSIRVYYESGVGDRPELVAQPVPVRLCFTARTWEPQFESYTATLPIGASGGWIFDSVDAIEDVADGSWHIPAARLPAGPPTAGHARAGAVSGVNFAVTLAGDLSDCGRRFIIWLASRATFWKYLLIGGWADERPCVVDNTDLSGAATDKVSFSRVSPDLLLADRRTALAFRSDTPIALRDAPVRRFQLWSQTDDGVRGRMLIKTLPMASADCLAMADPANPTTLVSEIYVSR
jgi:hypothetical protein